MLVTLKLYLQFVFLSKNVLFANVIDIEDPLVAQFHFILQEQRKFVKFCQVIMAKVRLSVKKW